MADRTHSKHTVSNKTIPRKSKAASDSNKAVSDPPLVNPRAQLFASSSSSSPFRMQDNRGAEDRTANKTPGVHSGIIVNSPSFDDSMSQDSETHNEREELVRDNDGKVVQHSAAAVSSESSLSKLSNTDRTISASSSLITGSGSAPFS